MTGHLQDTLFLVHVDDSDNFVFNRLYCTTNTLNGEEKSNSVNLEIRGSLTMANVELVECLMELDDKHELVEVYAHLFLYEIKCVDFLFTF